MLYFNISHMNIVNDQIRMKNNKGYLLIEMMIGSAIIVVTLVALLQLFMTFSVTVREARQQSIATSHAQFVLEEIKNLSRWSIYTAPPNEWDFDEGSISEKGMTPHQMKVSTPR